MFELAPEDAGAFRTAISDLKNGNRWAASVYVYDEDDYQTMRLFVTDDGKAGFALKGSDELVSLFVHPDSRHKGCAHSLLSTGVNVGGRRLDCFDTVLPKIYAREGFRPVARVAWKDEYAPDGWDYDTYQGFNAGRPDVVFMVYDPSSVDQPYRPTEGTLVADYDEGLEIAITAATSLVG